MHQPHTRALQNFPCGNSPAATEGTQDDAAAAAADEHSGWLVRTTRSIGIDYLEQLPPWHLLDVERAASKGDVKARFRELSRLFSFSTPNMVSRVYRRMFHPETGVAPWPEIIVQAVYKAIRTMAVIMEAKGAYVPGLAGSHIPGGAAFRQRRR